MTSHVRLRGAAAAVVICRHVLFSVHVMKAKRVAICNKKAEMELGDKDDAIF